MINRTILFNDRSTILFTFSLVDSGALMSVLAELPSARRFWALCGLVLLMTLKKCVIALAEKLMEEAQALRGAKFS